MLLNFRGWLCPGDSFSFGHEVLLGHFEKNRGSFLALLHAVRLPWVPDPGVQCPAGNWSLLLCTTWNKAGRRCWLLCRKSIHAFVSWSTASSRISGCLQYRELSRSNLKSRLISSLHFVFISCISCVDLMPIWCSISPIISCRIKFAPAWFTVRYWTWGLKPSECRNSGCRNSGISNPGSRPHETSRLYGAVNSNTRAMVL